MSWNHPPVPSGRRGAGRLGAGALLAALVLAGAAVTHAADATVSWEASPDPGVTGYTVHYGRASLAYEAAVDVGTATSWTAAGLEDGVAWYFAVSARDGYGQESALSEEAVFANGGEVVIPPVFSDDFGNGGRRGDPDWVRVKGKWSVDRKKRYQASVSRDNLSLVADPVLQEFGAGRIETKVRFAKRDGGTPNAAVLFHYDGSGAHRFVRLTPTGVTLGQDGEYQGLGNGFRLRARQRVRPDRWHLLRVDIDPSGLVTVFLDDLETPVLVAELPVLVPGAVGYRVRKSATKFDDLAVWDGSALP